MSGIRDKKWPIKLYHELEAAANQENWSSVARISGRIKDQLGPLSDNQKKTDDIVALKQLHERVVQKAEHAMSQIEEIITDENARMDGLSAYQQSEY